MKFDFKLVRHSKRCWKILRSTSLSLKIGELFDLCPTFDSLLISLVHPPRNRPAKASFTSLSTKVGEIVSELHLSLTSLLDRPVGVGQVELRLSILSVARKLSSCSPYGRMKRSLAGPLATAISNSLSSEGQSDFRLHLSRLTLSSDWQQTRMSLRLRYQLCRLSLNAMYQPQVSSLSRGRR